MIPPGYSGCLSNNATISGALSLSVVAQITVELAGSWTTAYFIGGGLGLLLLLLRVSVAESGIYTDVKADKTISRGNFLSFFTNKVRFVKYMKCIFVGLPIWFCIGILVLMANQFAPEMGIANIVPGKAIMWSYLFASMGDFSSGFISHALHSRKKTILYFMLFIERIKRKTVLTQKTKMIGLK